MRTQDAGRQTPAAARSLAVAAVLSVPGALLAQNGSTPPQSLEQLQESNRALERRVELLEQALGDRHHTPSPAVFDATLQDSFEEEQFWDEDDDFGLNFRYGDAVVSFQIFGDVGVEYNNPEIPRGDNSTFALGTVDFTANAQIGEHFRLLSETVLNTTSAGMTNTVQMRLWGMWEFNDQLYIKLGTEHSRVSRWNQLFHHGRYLELSVRRPLLTRFEADGGILPVHHTGLEVGGAVHKDFGRLEYWGAVSNGRGILATDRNTGGDPNESKKIDVGFAIYPACLPELRVGSSLTFDEIPRNPNFTNPERSRSIREFIATTHAELQVDALEIFGELAWIGHDARASGRNYDSHSGFLQVAYETGDWTPYTRFDYRDMAEGDPFFSDSVIPSRDLDAWQQIFGLRREIGQNAAFKVEFGVGEGDARIGGRIDEQTTIALAFQLAWSL